MAAPTSTEELIDFIRKSGVVPSDKLERFVSEQIDLRSAPSKSVNLFVQKKLLTSFQAKLLIAGRFRGFRIGQYLMQDQLGKGGMGAVYLGVHETLRRQAAIKVLPKDGNKLAVERFLREARAAAALDHPNIVRMHDVGCEGTLHYLVMEYVEGQTLEKLVNAGGPLSTQLALENKRLHFPTVKRRVLFFSEFVHEMGAIAILGFLEVEQLVIPRLLVGQRTQRR